MTKRYLILICAPIALLFAGAVGVGATGDDSNPPSTDTAQVAAVEEDAREALGVLDQSRGPGDALPEDVASQMKERQSFGMNPSLARRAIGNVTNSVYVIPARGHVCVSLTDGDGATVICPTTDEVAAGNAHPATVALAGGGIAIYGVVPDGVGSVLVHTGADDSAEVAVDGNTYYTVVPSGTQLRKVSYAGPSGPVAFDIHDPLRAMEATQP
jgi:hypothetical protein